MKGKRNLVEFCSEYTDLVKHGSGDSVYYAGLCPLHDDSNPSFIVYPNESDEASLCLCKTCHPQVMDIIEFARVRLGLSYDDAKSLTCENVTVTIATTRELEHMVGSKQKPFTQMQLARKLRKLHDKYEYSKVEQISKQIDQWFSANRHMKIVNELKKH